MNFIIFFIFLTVCLLENEIHSKSTPVDKQRPSWKSNMNKRAYQSLKNVGDVLNREKRDSVNVNHRRGGGGGGRGGGGWGDKSSSEENDYNPYYQYQGYPGYSTAYPGYPVQYPGYYSTPYPGYSTPYPGYSTLYPGYPTPYPGFPVATTTTARPYYNFNYNFTIPPIFARSPLKKQDEDQKQKNVKFEDVKHDLFDDEVHHEKAKNILLNHIPQKFAHDSNGKNLEIIHASFSKPENAALTVKYEPTINTASFGNERKPDFQDSFAQGPPPPGQGPFPGMGQGNFPGMGQGNFPGMSPDNPGIPQNAFPPFLNNTVFNLTQAVPNFFNIFNSSFNPFPNFPEMGRPFQHDQTRAFGGPNSQNGHRNRDRDRDDRFPNNFPNNFQMPNITQFFNNPLNFSIPGLPNLTAMIPNMPYPFRPPQ